MFIGIITNFRTTYSILLGTAFVGKATKNDLDTEKLILSCIKDCLTYEQNSVQYKTYVSRATELINLFDYVINLFTTENGLTIITQK